MELQGQVTIPASVQQVWQALNNAEVLRLCIPGCEAVEQIAADEMHARVLLRMGPVRARFTGKVKMTDIKPLQGYTLHFEGSGGSAGFAKGSSVITLRETDQVTQLDYTAQAAVAGKLGQIGGRLIDASSKQLADKFFANLKATLTTESRASDATAVVATDAAAVTPAPILTTTSPDQPIATRPAVHEATRLIWFFAGVAATSIGVWMGAHWLR